MPWYLKLAEVITILVYVILALVFIHFTKPISFFDNVVGAVAYGAFMIVSLTGILSILPENISKHFKNKA